MKHVSKSWSLLRRLAVLAVVGGMLLAASTPTFAQGNSGKGGGKGGGGGSEPPPAPVQYGLIRFEVPGEYTGGTVVLRAMNVWGETVGYWNGNSKPFYYDLHSGGAVATDLNDLEFDADHGIPAGWRIRAALGINKWGHICGALESLTDAEIHRGFVLELRPNPIGDSILPRLHLLPDQPGHRTHAVHINDAREVLGLIDTATPYVYRPGLHSAEPDAELQILPFEFDARFAHMNNPTEDRRAQIIFSIPGAGFYHYTLGDSAAALIDFPTNIGYIHGFSDSGSFCGYRKSKGNKNHGFLYDSHGTLHDLKDVESAQDVNAHDDVLGSPGLLFHSTHGELDVRALTIAESDAEQELWENSTPMFAKLTERGIDGTPESVSEFPTIFGSLRRFDTPYSFYYDLFVLVPLEVEAP